MKWKWEEKTVREHFVNYGGGYFEIREERDGNNEYTVFKNQECFASNKDLNKLKKLCECYLETNGHIPDSE